MAKHYTTTPQLDIALPIVWLHDTADSMVGLPSATEKDVKIRFVETRTYAAFNEFLDACESGKLQIKAIVLPYEVALKHIKDIRKLEALSHTPVVAIKKGNPPSLQEVGKALNLGIDDCFLKPVEWKALLSRVEALEQLKPMIASVEVERERAYRLPLGVRAGDILISGLLLTMLAIPFAVIAAAIRLESKGNPFYFSRRVAGAHVIKFWKFRSMRKDADQMLAQLAHLNQYDANGDKQVFVKFKNDPRVTRIGRIIRKTSIDELPQLINVFMGEMSIVGNRPLPTYEAEKITTDQYAERFLAPAGITGLWQVEKRGQGDMSYEERMELDITYARKRSFAMDVRLFFKTATGAFMQKENV